MFFVPDNFRNFKTGYILIPLLCLLTIYLYCSDSFEKIL